MWSLSLWDVGFPLEWWSWLVGRMSSMTTFLLTTLVLPGEAVTHNEDNLQFAKLYHSITFIGSRAMCNVLNAVWSKENLGEEIQTLRDYCRIKLSWTRKNFNLIFDKFDQQYLDKDICYENYDICYLCRVLENVLNHVYCQLDPDCQEHIKKLRKKRNKVCHYYGHMEGNLSTEIDQLKETIRSIYKGVGKYLDIDFSQNITEMEHMLTEILDTNFVFGEQVKEIETFEENKRSRMIIQGRQELEAQYRKLRVLNPCTWINENNDKVRRFEVDKIFTPLKLEGQREIELKDIFTAKMGRGAILPPILIYKGLAGSGKSALCRYLIFNWHTKKEEIDMLSSFDLVFLVEIRRMRCRKVIDFLQEMILKNTCKNFDPKDVILLLKGLDLLFIIDGYDESGEQDKELVENILAIFSNHRILITTRPDYHEDVISLAKRYAAYQSVEVCGFDDKRKEEFITKVFSVIEEKDKCMRQTIKFLNYLSNRGYALDEHLKLPLTLALLIYLWKENPEVVNSVTSATRLYMELFRLCQKKLAERLCCTKSFRSAKLYSHLDDLILLLGQQAWLMLKDANNLVNKDIYYVLEKECKTRNIDVTELMSAFLMCHVDEDDDELVYEFLHKTQMEYLAAGFLADQVKRKRKTLEEIKQDIGYSSWRHHQEVLKYLTGHLAIHSQENSDILEASFPHLSKLFSVAEIESDNYNYWWNLVVEALFNSSVCKGIAQNQLPVKHWQLNARQVVSALNLLIRTSVSLKTLTIDISCDVEPYNIKYFLDVMKSLKFKIQDRHNKRCPILVEIHFWRHVQYQHSRPSDDFLRALYPWAHLINFTGSLGEQIEGKEVLAYCYNLKNIRARVASPKALACLSRSLEKIWKSVRIIRLTLAISVEVRPEELAVLKFRGNLELLLRNIRDADKEWLVQVVRRIGNQ
ncbi:uncharacterized protein LOC134788596 [Penaeus indicus]|uniref:uncharacterized protein LOC134788596 n=1 Tax=Penaeus indicus TaxID=29960 RepID=UPI00300D5EC5